MAGEFARYAGAEAGVAGEAALSVWVLGPMRRAGSVLVNAIALVVAYATLALSFAILVLGISGLHGYVAMGASMESVVPGSVVLFTPVSSDAVRVGDVITVALPDRILTNRVVAIEREAGGGALFTLRGDAAVSPEPVRVGPAPVVGRPHAAIPNLGYVITYAQGYVAPAAMGLVIWLLFGIASRARTRERDVVGGRVVF